jgi:hypothetical protein
MLPKFKSDNKELMMLQTTWAQKLDPVLENQLINGLLLQSIYLTIGDNVINHMLGRKLTGWIITRKRSNSNIYDTQDNNPVPKLTLTLNASANCIVDLYVY